MWYNIFGDNMKIDISDIINKGVGSINFKGEVVIPEELIKTTEIIRLENVICEGKIIDAYDFGYTLEAKLSGSMVLPCSVSLEEVDYKFKTSFTEEIEKTDTNLLDISDILWDNIVLEMPLKVTKSDASVITSGEGWDLNKEKSDIDPRLEKLKELYKEEE